MTADATRRYLALMSPAERRMAVRAFVARVNEDPEGRLPYTALWWALACDIYDLERVEDELAADIDDLGI